MTEYITGIDIGTGSTKAVSINSSGEVLCTTQVSYPAIQFQPHYHEQAPELIWQAFVKCILRTTEKLSANPAAIVLSSAMHSIIPVNQKGEPLMNMITWADSRSADIATQLYASPEGESLYRRTGMPIHAMSPLCKIIWLRNNDLQLFNRTHKFISIKEYVWYKLFGKFEVDYSIASATGLFDVLALQWNDLALKTASVDADKLSVPVNTDFSRSDLTNDSRNSLKLDSRTTFVIGASDGCLAHLGSFALEPGVASLTIGTSGAVRISSNTPHYDFKAMTFNYRLDENVFISGGPINNGGVVLKWFLENILQLKLLSAAEFAAILQTVQQVPPGSDNLIFLPYLLGERAPIWNSKSCGVFFGMTLGHRQEHFIRAVLEGISLALYSVARSMENSGAIKKIMVSGGVVHSAEWLQIIADIFDKEVCLVNTEDASALGASYLGIKAIGKNEDYQKLFTKTREHVGYFPQKSNHETYMEIYHRFIRLYEKLKDEMV